MSKVLEGYKYTKEHEWIKKLDNGNYQVGITDYAQNSLGDIVYVELPENGSEIKQNDSIGTIESVKAVSDIYSPLTGSVTSINEAIADDPALVNSDPYENGWLLQVAITEESQLDSLMSAGEYEELIKTL